MTRNVGNTDRIVRLVAALVLFAAALAMQNILFGVLGAILLFTAGVAWCPLYLPFGISTCRADSQKP